MITSEDFNINFFNSLPIEFKSDTFSIPWVNFKGVLYKPGMLLIIDIDLNGCIFGEILYILINKSRMPYLVCKLFLTVGFNSHYHAYEIKKYNKSESNLIGCYLKDLKDSTQTILRVLGNGKLYASLRYAL